MLFSPSKIQANVKCVEPLHKEKIVHFTTPCIIALNALSDRKKINRNRIKCFASFVDEKTDAIRSEMENKWPTSGHNVSASRSLKQKAEKILFTSTKFVAKLK